MDEKVREETVKELEKLKSYYEQLPTLFDMTPENKEANRKTVKSLDIAISKMKYNTTDNKTKHIINLIRHHFEEDDEAFKDDVFKIEWEFRKQGQEEVAEYIRVQYSDVCVFVPM